jgi:hypothetical protein
MKLMLSSTLLLMIQEFHFHLSCVHVSKKNNDTRKC